MKRLIVLTLIMASLSLTVGILVPSFAQSPAADDTPTFYRLVPGTYVNGWPRFTITYPKEWVERAHGPFEIFRASAPGPAPYPAFAYAPVPNIPLDDLVTGIVSTFKRAALEVTLVSDKVTQLRDGTTARELVLHMLMNGEPFDVMGFFTKKGGLIVNMGVESRSGIMGDDLKAILYSIKFEPEKDRPVDVVRVPLGVREFLDEHCRASVAHDITPIMAGYSDKYLNSGMRKGEIERFLRPFVGRLTSFEMVITDFVLDGDRAYIAGFVQNNLGTATLAETSLIKENGKWKWYGNQREVAP
jgi:hypothetical protein